MLFLPRTPGEKPGELITFYLKDGRTVSGGVPFKGPAVDGAVEKVVIDHPARHDIITLIGSTYVLFNDAIVVPGLGKMVTTLVGVFDGVQAKGFIVHPQMIEETPISLAHLQQTMSDKVFKYA